MGSRARARDPMEKSRRVVAFDKLVRGESRAEPDDSLRKRLKGPVAALPRSAWSAA